LVGACYGNVVRIVVAMSGGVDSAVAAARLHDAGHEVVGVTLHLWDYPEADQPGGHGRCCAPEDQYDARRTADALGFAHYTFDRRKLFARVVVDPFVLGYASGETPSPCAACNRGVKLAELFAIADRFGAELVATGHYARIVRDDGRARLAAGIDGGKDQSYFLYATPSAQLERLVFPLGESLKVDVRREAVARALPGAHKGESQELCFVGGGTGAYAKFIEARADAKVRPGRILDEAGQVVGRHTGMHQFTVGQRRGTGVALGKPAFVTRIDPETADVHLGEEAALQSLAAELTDVVLAEGVTLPRRARVRVRYRHEGAHATVSPTKGCDDGLLTQRPLQRAQNVSVQFDSPVRAVTRGQIAVLYDGDRVLGGGTIASASVRVVDVRAPAALRSTV
jgi:tRNA-specific 2-thiouridylase